MGETIDVGVLLELLHQMNGHRVLQLRHFSREDSRATVRTSGELLILKELIYQLETYLEEGQLKRPPREELFDVYEDISRCISQADELNADGMDEELDDPVSFQ